MTLYLLMMILFVLYATIETQYEYDFYSWANGGLQMFFGCVYLCVDYFVQGPAYDLITSSLAEGWPTLTMRLLGYLFVGAVVWSSFRYFHMLYMFGQKFPGSDLEGLEPKKQKRRFLYWTLLWPVDLSWFVIKRPLFWVWEFFYDIASRGYETIYEWMSKKKSK